MLRREDNPWLYQALKDYFMFSGKSIKNSGVITDEELLSIEKLSITSVSMENYPVSMKGIEQLKNLKQLSIEPVDYMYVAKSYGQVIHNESFSPEKKKQELMYIEQEFNRNQLSDNDLEYLTSQLTNLEVLNLPEQRYITKINLSNMPNLKTLNLKNCKCLQVVKGLDKIDIVEKHKDEILTVNLSGCELLEDIANLPKIFNKIMCTFNYGLCDIEISNVGMLKLLKKYEKISHKQNELSGKDIVLAKELYKENFRDTGILDESLSAKLSESLGGAQVFKCSENGQSGIYYVTDVMQIIRFKKDVEKILEQIGVKDKKTDIEKLYCIYNWITKNIEYDFDIIEIEDKNERKTLKSKYNRDIHSGVRSSWYTFSNKKGVCAGIAKLFQTMVSLVDFDKPIFAKTVSCSSVKNNDKDPRKNIAGHEAVKLIIGGKIYYFDPTWDLARKKGLDGTNNYFCLNKEEFEKSHILTYLDMEDENSPSLQQRLRDNLFKEQDKERIA